MSLQHCVVCDACGKHAAANPRLNFERWRDTLQMVPEGWFIEAAGMHVDPSVQTLVQTFCSAECVAVARGADSLIIGQTPRRTATAPAGPDDDDDIVRIIPDGGGVIRGVKW